MKVAARSNFSGVQQTGIEQEYCQSVVLKVDFKKDLLLFNAEFTGRHNNDNEGAV